MSIVRAYLENSLDKTTGVSKLYYMGPMFRAERPQKGRFANSIISALKF